MRGVKNFIMLIFVLLLAFAFSVSAQYVCVTDVKNNNQFGTGLNNGCGASGGCQQRIEQGLNNTNIWYAWTMDNTAGGNLSGWAWQSTTWVASGVTAGFNNESSLMQRTHPSGSLLFIPRRAGWIFSSGMDRDGRLMSLNPLLEISL